jgi:hypothetical protein
MRGQDIGIIAPYVAQISLLTRLLNTDKRFQARFIRVLGPTRARELAQIEIKTVDGFEGREKDVIIFSTVRNNPGGYIGFLADRRRLNVGLTRAKRSLVVVGSLKTLASSSSSNVFAGAQQSHVEPLRYRTMVGRVTQQTTKKKRESAQTSEGTMVMTTNSKDKPEDGRTVLSSAVGGPDATTKTKTKTMTAKDSLSESFLAPSDTVIVVEEEQVQEHINRPTTPAIAVQGNEGGKNTRAALSQQRQENSSTSTTATSTDTIHYSTTATAAAAAPSVGSTATATHRTALTSRTSSRIRQPQQQHQHKGDAWWRFAEFLHQERLVIELTGERLQRALYGQMPVGGKKGLGPGSSSARSRQGRVGVVVSLDAMDA